MSLVYNMFYARMVFETEGILNKNSYFDYISLMYQSKCVCLGSFQFLISLIVSQKPDFLIYFCVPLCIVEVF